MSLLTISDTIRGAYPATDPVTGTIGFPASPMVRCSSAAGFVAEYTADATVNIYSGLTGLHGVTTFNTIHCIAIDLIKTAATSSGTIVITGAGVFNKLAATTIDAGSTENLAAASGDCIWSYKIAHVDGLNVTSGTNTIDLNFTTPVGFKARLTVIAA